MFWSGRQTNRSGDLPGLRDRADAAVRLVGAFLTLADDYAVDWDFPGDGAPFGGARRDRGAAQRNRSESRRAHTDAHRRPVASRAPARRPAPPARVTPCLSPLPPRPHVASRRDGSTRDR
jgi:hypothetical protein